MEEKVNALVLRAVDYKDNDKILTLYSLEMGKLTAGIKGVKKASAKLKFATEPFCFAEFVLAKRGDRYTVINASHIDSFYNLRTNYAKYLVSSVLSEFALNFLEPEIKDLAFFNNFITAVKMVCYQKNERVTLAKFLYESLKGLGYGLEFLPCNYCGNDIANRVFFNAGDGTFCCENCFKSEYMEITNETYQTLKIIENISYGEIENLAVNETAINKFLKFIFYYLNYKTEVKFNSEKSLFS